MKISRASSPPVWVRPLCRAAARKKPAPSAALCAIFSPNSKKNILFLKESLLSATGNIETSRLLDTRFLDLEGNRDETEPSFSALVTLQPL